MIKKAVIPVAGYATRMLPITKVLPKAMLSIVNKPIIEYLIDEIVEAGIKEILLITNSYSTIIQEHFSRNYELEYYLEMNDNTELFEKIKGKYENTNIYVKRATTNQSLADSIYDAKDFVGEEPFLLVLGDEILEKESHCSQKIVRQYNELKKPIIAIKKISIEEQHKYGIIEGKKLEKNDMYVIDRMIEKPQKGQTDSNLAILRKICIR